MPIKNKKKTIEIYNVDNESIESNPIYTTSVSAGFPSPADDYIDQKLDLNKYLIKNPSATFYVKVSGNSMVNAGINDGDILIVDRSLTPKQNSIVIGVLDGEFTVKRIRKTKEKLFLIPENEDYLPTEITPEIDFKIWGVVTNIIHRL